MMTTFPEESLQRPKVAVLKGKAKPQKGTASTPEPPRSHRRGRGGVIFKQRDETSSQPHQYLLFCRYNEKIGATRGQICGGYSSGHKALLFMGRQRPFPTKFQDV